MVSVKPTSAKPQGYDCIPPEVVKVIHSSMKSLLLLVLLVVYVSANSVWPQPQKMECSGSSYTLSPSSWNYVMKGVVTSSPKFHEAWSRYEDIIFVGRNSDKLTRTADGDISSVDVTIAKDEPLSLGVSEAYTLTVSSEGASIVAETVWGALRALETLSQLVNVSRSSMGSSLSYTVAACAITDAPRFAWRGMLIDTTRHYMPVNKILQILDVLSFNKFNVLHWHIIDAESFPMVVETYPELSAKGAYAPEAIFSPSDVQQVIKEAELRGIRVVMEFDTPGHSASWGKGYPEIVTTCPALSANINNIPLNPSHNLTYAVLAGVLDQSFKVNSDAYVHLGGDEVVYACWAADPSVVQFANAMGFGSNWSELYNWHMQKALDVVNQSEKSAVVWEEVFEGQVNLPKSAIVQSWKSQTVLHNIVAAGYNGLLSAGWYLDREVPGTDTHYEWEDTWIDFYANEPIGASFSEKEASLVLGGEAAMWGEQVNEFNFDSRVWPRASAIAERLWSAKDVTDPLAATPRLNEWSCRMERRGVKCGPIEPSYCEMY